MHFVLCANTLLHMDACLALLRAAFGCMAAASAFPS